MTYGSLSYELLKLDSCPLGKLQKKNYYNWTWQLYFKKHIQPPT